MIPFDPAKIEYDFVKIKNVTTAIGGSVSILDEDASTDDKEVFRRVAVPMPVARDFMVVNRTGKFLRPVEACLMRYDGRVVCIEKHPLGAMGDRYSESVDGTIRRWTPSCQRNMEEFVLPITNRPERTWNFDGRFVYAFPSPNTSVCIRNADFLSSDSSFRKVTCTAIDLQNCSRSDKIQPKDRCCLAFITNAPDGSLTYGVTPPIWKDLESLGGRQLQMSGLEKKHSYQFDAIDMYLGVNLNFALKAGQEIGKAFGYKYIQPLQLPKMMIELRTVNLPNVPKDVKQSCEIGLSFTHAVAWLIGLQQKAETLETYMIVRSLLKYLTTKGIFRRNIMEREVVYRQDKTAADIQLLNVNEYMKSVGSDALMSLAAMIQQARISATGRRSTTETNTVGTLYAD